MNNEIDSSNKKFFAQSDCPCVMIDNNSYKELKEQAMKNAQDIKNEVNVKYKEYLSNTDINVTFKIPSLNLIARGSGIIIPIEDEYSEYSSQYSYDEKIKYGIVERLTKDIEAHFKGWRKEVRQEFNFMQNNLLQRVKKDVYTIALLSIAVIIETICLIFLI